MSLEGSTDTACNYAGWLDMRTRAGWQTRWCEAYWLDDKSQFARSHSKGDAASRKVSCISQVGTPARVITETTTTFGDAASASGRRMIIDLLASSAGAVESLELKAKTREEARRWVCAIHRILACKYASRPSAGRMDFRTYVGSHSTFTSVLNAGGGRASVGGSGNGGGGVGGSDASRPLSSFTPAKHPFREGRYGYDGYTRSDFEVPPSALLEVTLAQILPHVKETSEAYGNYHAARRGRQEEVATREHDLLAEAAAKTAVESGGEEAMLQQVLESDPELRAIPLLFFERDFQLSNPTTFSAACGEFPLALESAHEAMGLQEQLSHYLDLVETRLLSRIARCVFVGVLQRRRRRRRRPTTTTSSSSSSPSPSLSSSSSSHYHIAPASSITMYSTELVYYYLSVCRDPICPPPSQTKWAVLQCAFGSSAASGNARM